LIVAKAFISPINGDKERARESKCVVSASATVRVKRSRFKRKTECKSETLGFVGLYWVELSVCIIPPIIYNLLPPWTYLVLGNHVNLLVCVCFRSRIHNKLISEH
jgi:hypothetical protein